MPRRLDALTVEDDHGVVGDPDFLGSLECLRGHRRDGDEHLGTGIGELLGDLARGEQRVDRRGRRTRAQHSVEDGGERGNVRRENADDVADTDAASRESACCSVDLADQLAICGLRVGLGIDERDAVEIVVGDVAEQVLVNADIRDLDVGVGTLDAHGTSVGKSVKSIVPMAVATM